MTKSLKSRSLKAMPYPKISNISPRSLHSEQIACTVGSRAAVGQHQITLAL